MKICKDCKYFSPSDVWKNEAWCALHVDPVMGVAKSVDCADNRKHGFLLCRLLGTCGKEARCFESKTVSEDPMSDCLGEVIKASRYQWKDAPTWATCAAIDINGIGYFHEVKPHLHNYDRKEWLSKGRVKEIRRKMLRDGEDWETTLEMKP